ncbi:ribonuclease HII, partial [Francisella tularensis subsp. holarctica]|nr:ribonuclease HII [Francisella tularensis subsp. holarctica]
SLYHQIITHAMAYTIVEISPQLIDELNILQATLKAIHQVENNLERQFDKVFVDGNKLPNWDYNSEALVKGDSKIIEISAASILA